MTSARQSAGWTSQTTSFAPLLSPPPISFTRSKAAPGRKRRGRTQQAVLAPAERLSGHAVTMLVARRRTTTSISKITQNRPPAPTASARKKSSAARSSDSDMVQWVQEPLPGERKKAPRRPRRDVDRAGRRMKRSCSGGGGEAFAFGVRHAPQDAQRRRGAWLLFGPTSTAGAAGVAGVAGVAEDIRTT